MAEAGSQPDSTQSDQPRPEVSSATADSEWEEVYVEASWIRKLIYDIVLWSFCVVFDCFFREIRSRGSFNLPRSGPTIFVGAPHANQFVDPIILMGQVQQRAGRRISFLVAEKSHRRKFIGLISRSQMAIPVSRAQDNLKGGRGKIRRDSENPLRIVGEDTYFTQDCANQRMLALPNSLGTSEIGEVVSDTELILKKEFRHPNTEAEEKANRILAEGTSYKLAPKIDQSIVYKKVFQHLAHGNSIGIFPEGGSHDRTDLLPLKAGVAIMALGAMSSDKSCKVKIVPCGMNYFHPHKFRSRAMVEFGRPIEISDELVSMYENKESTKDAIKEVLRIITKGLKSVTVTCPDYETLVCIQTARRLYSNNFSSRLSLESILEMNRRLVKGYEHFQNEPRIQELKEKILAYHEVLRLSGIPDHKVNDYRPEKRLQTFAELLGNLFQFALLGLLALPGALLFFPVFVATRKISAKKAKEALAASTVKIKAIDVVATWKILVSLGFAPLLYIFYSTVGTYIIRSRYYVEPGFGKTAFTFFGFYIFSATITYSALIVGDIGMDSFKRLKPLWLFLTDSETLSNLKKERQELSLEITEVVNEFGPQLFSDFNLLDYQKKVESKRKKKRSEKYRKKAFEVSSMGLDSSDEEEELKTQDVRRRRAARKQAASTTEAPSNRFDNKSMGINISNVPIFSNDLYGGTSSAPTTDVSSISSELSSDYQSSDGENENDDSQLKDRIRDRIHDSRHD
ncbi:hypothetical protein LJB42_004749 [Komagataella kurtzmanii]|nr:hypothetical protein LJB42_004749 [Komagataella kurtzmanii]